MHTYVAWTELPGCLPTASIYLFLLQSNQDVCDICLKCTLYSCFSQPRGSESQCEKLPHRRSSICHPNNSYLQWCIVLCSGETIQLDRNNFRMSQPPPPNYSPRTKTYLAQKKQSLTSCRNVNRRKLGSTEKAAHYHQILPFWEFGYHGTLNITTTFNLQNCSWPPHISLFHSPVLCAADVIFSLFIFPQDNPPPTPAPANNLVDCSASSTQGGHRTIVCMG